MNDAQARAAALDLSRHVAIRAPAGSGKTALLIQRMLAALADCEEPEAVLAITFTRKAAAEIRERLLQALAAAAGPAPENEHEQLTWRLARAVRERDSARGWGLAENAGRLRATTIDALNRDIAGRLPLLLDRCRGFVYCLARTGVTVRVVDDAGADCAPDMPGEVIVSGDVVMSGYWRNPEATASALRDGWLHTGDIGSLDAQGVLTLKDRSKDVIISGGSNIYPREVEAVLLRYPGVSEANVTGRPHADWGEEVVAFVVAEDGVTAEALDRFCLDHIARFKRPKSYRFVPSLPKSSYGKILKTELRRMLAETEPASKTL